MRTEELDYDLDPSVVAQTPIEPRDAARLLIDDGPARPIRHSRIEMLARHLRPGDVVVVNETRVRHARFRCRKASGGAVEVLLLEPLGGDRWIALVGSNRSIKSGVVLTVGAADELRFVVGESAGEGRRIVELQTEVPGHEALIARLGEVPLPPYITVPLADAERYQTVFAAQPGSAAAPTAGLHFTEDVIESLRQGGVEVLRVELSVGSATFRPITTDRVEDHELHTEQYRVPSEVLDACDRATRVIAVGTTTVRALESAATTGELQGRSGLFIRPGYRWRVVDVLLTNFHLPRSSLLVLVEAFVGPRWRALYRLAAGSGYRFLSFGDAMLLTDRVDQP